MMRLIVGVISGAIVFLFVLVLELLVVHNALADLPRSYSILLHTVCLLIPQRYPGRGGMQ